MVFTLNFNNEVELCVIRVNYHYRKFSCHMLCVAVIEVALPLISVTKIRLFFDFCNFLGSYFCAAAYMDSV